MNIMISEGMDHQKCPSLHLDVTHKVQDALYIRKIASQKPMMGVWIAWKKNAKFCDSPFEECNAM